MPEAVRKKVDKMLKGLTPKHQRQLSVSTSNALDRFPVVEAVLEHRKLVLLLDYDGTLTPIVNDPSKAVLSERVRSILRELPKHFITGVISGRSLGKIRSFVGVPGLFYAGSHGFDILAPSQPGGSRKSNSRPSEEQVTEQESSVNGEVGGEGGQNGKPLGAEAEEKRDVAQVQEGGVPGTGPGGVLEEVRHQVAEEYLPVMSTIRDQLIEELEGIDRAEVEDNRFSISIHYRNCAREDVPRVREVVMRVQARHERIRMGSGKEVFELQPDIAWDKGKAVLWLLDKLVVPMAEKSTALVDAALANGGVHVGNGNSSRPAGNGPVEKLAVCEESPGVVEEQQEDGDDDGAGDAETFFTIFIGDDKTDENAFRVFTGGYPGSAGHEGLGILVSEESRETNAAYTLRNPDEVALFLEKIAAYGSQRWCSVHR